MVLSLFLLLCTIITDIITYQNRSADMSQSPEDYSFFVYASVIKGDCSNQSDDNVRAEATIRKASTGNSETIPMRDDGICRFISTSLRSSFMIYKYLLFGKKT